MLNRLVGLGSFVQNDRIDCNSYNDVSDRLRFFRLHDQLNGMLDRSVAFLYVFCAHKRSANVTFDKYRSVSDWYRLTVWYRLHRLISFGRSPYWSAEARFVCLAPTVCSV